SRARRIGARSRPRPPHRRRWRRTPDACRGGRQESRRPARGAEGREEGDRRSAAMKVLALDFGRARTGVAVSDPTGTVARPLGVVEAAATDNGLGRIAALAAEQNAEEIVVGLPLTMRGARGEQAQETEEITTNGKTTQTVIAMPKPFHVVFPEGFTIADMAARVHAVA